MAPSLHRRDFLKKAFSATTGALAAGGIAGCRSTVREIDLSGMSRRDPPNLIIFVTDDQRWDTLGIMGNPVIHTPHLDRLANHGVVFDNMFVTTSICSASRASLFTGTYARRHGIHDFSTGLSAEQWKNSYPGQLKGCGYTTAFIGKLGVGQEAPVGLFDYWKGFMGQGRYFESKDPEKKHLTEKMGDQALAFLDQAKKETPFCLSVSFKAAHAMDYDPHPFPYDPKFESLYQGIKMPVPATATQAHYDNLPEFLKETEGRKRWKNRFHNPARHQESIRNYYRLISGVDHAVGRITKKLEEKGLAQNTLLLFTSDNGFFLGERGLAGKWYMYEPSIRVPLVVFDPRLPSSLQGRRVSDMVLNLDVAPTLLDLAGVPIPEVMQGESLIPFLEKRIVPWRGEWFYEHLFDHPLIPKSEGVRTEKWKYVRWVEQDPVYEELFDLEKDPEEIKNLAGDPAFADRLNQLRSRWARLRDRVR
jgi:arylsulfatase A-like enzyme